MCKVQPAQTVFFQQCCILMLVFQVLNKNWWRLLIGNQSTCMYDAETLTQGSGSEFNCVRTKSERISPYVNQPEKISLKLQASLFNIK